MRAMIPSWSILEARRDQPRASANGPAGGMGELSPRGRHANFSLRAMRARGTVAAGICSPRGGVVMSCDVVRCRPYRRMSRYCSGYRGKTDITVDVTICRICPKCPLVGAVARSASIRLFGRNVRFGCHARDRRCRAHWAIWIRSRKVRYCRGSCRESQRRYWMRWGRCVRRMS